MADKHQSFNKNVSYGLEICIMITHGFEFTNLRFANLIIHELCIIMLCHTGFRQGVHVYDSYAILKKRYDNIQNGMFGITRLPQLILAYVSDTYENT